jgi:hypothetical protein
MVGLVIQLLLPLRNQFKSLGHSIYFEHHAKRCASIVVAASSCVAWKSTYNNIFYVILFCYIFFALIAKI